MMNKHKIARIGPNYRVSCFTNVCTDINCDYKECNHIAPEYFVNPEPLYCPQCGKLI